MSWCLQLDNILLHVDPASPGVPCIKLCDFGFSKYERQSISKTSCGTPECAYFRLPHLPSHATALHAAICFLRF